jgi:hypothetical protein
MATHIKNHNRIRHTKFNEFVTKSEANGEEYARIIALKGSDARFEVEIIPSGIITLAKTKGSLIKGPGKKKLEKDNIVLIQKDTSFTAVDKYYIIHKYNKDDERKLRKSGELTTNINDNLVIGNFDDSDNENDGIDISRI